MQHVVATSFAVVGACTHVVGGMPIDAVAWPLSQKSSSPRHESHWSSRPLLALASPNPPGRFYTDPRLPLHPRKGYEACHTLECPTPAFPLKDP